MGRWTQTGIATWYHSQPGNHRTASGERYDAFALTAAHRTLPMQSLVLVTNLKTRSQVVVRINDRGPFVKGRVIDVSMAAAKKLDMIHSGSAPVKWELMHTPSSFKSGER
jgi:rare lipoprotein A